MDLTTGNMIKNIRKQAGITQKQLSEKYEIPISTIKDWELEKHKCPPYVAKLLIDRLALDFPVQQEQEKPLYNLYEDSFDYGTAAEMYLYDLKDEVEYFFNEVRYAAYGKEVEAIDDYCIKEFKMSPEYLDEIKAFLSGEHNGDWCYPAYERAVVSYLYNTYKDKIIK